MQDAAVVRVLDRLGDPLHVSGCSRRGQRIVLDQCRQAGAFDVIHREIMLAILFTHLVNGDDVRMNQVGRHRFGLRPKTTRESLARKRECLHGNNLIAADLACLVNHARVAAADFRQELVIAEGPQRRFGWRRTRRWDRLTAGETGIAQNEHSQASGANAIQNADRHSGATLRTCLRLDHDPLLRRNIRR